MTQIDLMKIGGAGFGSSLSHHLRIMYPKSNVTNIVVVSAFPGMTRILDHVHTALMRNLLKENEHSSFEDIAQKFWINGITADTFKLLNTISPGDLNRESQIEFLDACYDHISTVWDVIHNRYEELGNNMPNDREKKSACLEHHRQETLAQGELLTCLIIREFLTLKGIDFYYVPAISFMHAKPRIINISNGVKYFNCDVAQSVKYFSDVVTGWSVSRQMPCLILTEGYIASTVFKMEKDTKIVNLEDVAERKAVQQKRQVVTMGFDASDLTVAVVATCLKFHALIDLRNVCFYKTHVVDFLSGQPADNQKYSFYLFEAQVKTASRRKSSGQPPESHKVGRYLVQPKALGLLYEHKIAFDIKEIEMTSMVRTCYTVGSEKSKS